MPIGIYEKDDIDALADEIRLRNGGGVPMTVKEMKDEIASIYFNGEGNGYSDGYASGFGEGKAQGRTEGLEEGKAIGYTEGKADGIAEGKKSQYDEHWDNFQNYGTRTYYGDAFRNTTFEHIRPKYKITPTEQGSGIRIFYDCDNLKKVEAKYFDLSQIPIGRYASEGLYYTFTSCAVLEEIEDIGLSPSYSYTGTFNYCTKLKTIAKITVDENTRFDSTTTFGNCSALENLTIAGTIGQNGFDIHWSTKLSKASITSIINALSTTTSGLTVTLSKTAVNNAFNGGSTGDEWLNLVATKNNWTISLV